MIFSLSDYDGTDIDMWVNYFKSIRKLEKKNQKFEKN